MDQKRYRPYHPVLDFEMDGPLHSISVRMTGEGNTSVEKDFQIQLLDQFKPIVRTGAAEEVTEIPLFYWLRFLSLQGLLEIIGLGLLLSIIRIYRWRIIAL